MRYQHSSLKGLKPHKRYELKWQHVTTCFESDLGILFSVFILCRYIPRLVLIAER